MFFKSFGFNMSGNSFAASLDWYFNYTNSLLFGVLAMVLVLICYLFVEKSFFKLSGKPYRFVEALCVVAPTLLVCSLVYYSLWMLYSMSMLEVQSLLTLKVVGQQWFWHYEFSDLGEGFDCAITPLEELSPASLHRNFATTPALTLPQGLSVRGCLTSSDVIHSWSVPSLGVKSDCSPGLLTTVSFKPGLVGTFYGSCAEICGVGHSAMPIHLEVVTPNLFISSLEGLTF